MNGRGNGWFKHWSTVVCTVPAATVSVAIVFIVVVFMETVQAFSSLTTMLLNRSSFSGSFIAKVLSDAALKKTERRWRRCRHQCRMFPIERRVKVATSLPIKLHGRRVSLRVSVCVCVFHFSVKVLSAPTSTSHHLSALQLYWVT